MYTSVTIDELLPQISVGHSPLPELTLLCCLGDSCLLSLVIGYIYVCDFRMCDVQYICHVCRCICMYVCMYVHVWHKLKVVTVGIKLIPDRSVASVRNLFKKFPQLSPTLQIKMNKNIREKPTSDLRNAQYNYLKHITSI